MHAAIESQIAGAGGPHGEHVHQTCQTSKNRRTFLQVLDVPGGEGDPDAVHLGEVFLHTRLSNWLSCHLCVQYYSQTSTLTAACRSAERPAGPTTLHAHLCLVPESDASRQKPVTEGQGAFVSGSERG